MRRSALRLLLPSCLTILLAPGTSLGSVAPSSGTLRWGIAAGVPASITSIPSMSLTWPAGRSIALWSDIAYVRQSTMPGIRYALPASGFPGARYGPFPVTYRTRLVPLTVGLRGYLRPGEGRPLGPFIEAGPTGTLASYTGDDGRSHFAMLGGFRTGTGLRLAGPDGSHLELGMSYYLAEAFGKRTDAVGRIGTPGEIDFSLYTAYAALGLGR